MGTEGLKTPPKPKKPPTTVPTGFDEWLPNFKRGLKDISIETEGEGHLEDRQEIVQDDSSGHHSEEPPIPIKDEETQPLIPPGLKIAMEIVDEHQKKVGPESAAFLKCDRMDDVMLKVRQLDPPARAEACKKMKAAYEAASQRRVDLGKALKDVHRDQLPEDQQKSFDKARSTLANAVTHLPDDFTSQASKFLDRLNTLSLDDEARKKLSEETIEEGKVNRDEELNTFKEVIGKRGTKELDRLNPFDPMVADLTGTTGDKSTDVQQGFENKEKIQKVLDAALTRAHRIRDLGGPTAIQDAEAQLAHIPRAFWPPEFVKELQAWRKVEREMLDLAVAKQMEKMLGESKKDDKEGESVVGKGGKASKVAGTVVSTISSVTQLDQKMPLVDITIKLWPDEDRKVIEESIASSLEEVAVLLETVDDGMTLIQKINKEGVEALKPKDIQELTATLAKYGKRVQGALKTAEKFPGAKEAIERAMPGMLIAVGGLEFAQALAALNKARNLKGNTGKMMERALGSTDIDDGGAFVNTLMNEMEARERQMDEEKFNMVQAGFKVAEGVSGVVGPHGYVSAKGIAVVGKAITYGGKVYFANVDFSAAQRAKKTLFRAQAGSGVDRLQVFEESGAYAKMYIAILVKEGNRLAEDFIIQRGYSDKDVDRKEVSTVILSEFLLKHAGQKDERTTTDSRLSATMGGVVGVTGEEVKEMGTGLLEKASKFKEKYFPSDLPYPGTDYDPAWKHSPDTVKLVESSWQITFKDAIAKAGLFDDGKGVSPAINKANKVLVTLEIQEFTVVGTKDALQKAATNTASPLRKKELLLQAIQELDGADDGICEWEPWHTPYTDAQVVGTHEGMAQYQLALWKEIRSIRTLLETKLMEDGWLLGDKGVTVPPMDLTWKHGTENLSPKEWKEQRKEALEKAWRNDEIGQDPGVEEALKKVETTAKPAAAPENRASKIWRTAQQDYHAALEALLVKLQAYWQTCNHDGLRSYINALQLKAAAELRRLDVLLYPGKESFDLDVNKEGKPITQKFSSDAWAKAYNGALGYIAEVPEAQPLNDAFKAWETAVKKETGQKDPKKLREARGDIRAALAEICTLATKAGGKVGTEAMVNYLGFILNHARSLLNQVVTTMGDVSFPYNVKLFRKANWEEAYNKAVAVGAVPANKGAADISKALEKHEKDLISFSGKLTPQAKRKLAEDLVKDLEKVQEAIATLRAVEGYSENKAMEACLAELWSLSENYKEKEYIKSSISGEKADFPKFSFRFDENHWANTVKPKAIEEGVLGETEGTGLSSTMRDGLYRFNEFMRVTKQPEVEDTKRGTRIQYKREAREALAKLVKAAETQKSKNANKNYQAYMEECIAQANKKLQEMDNIKDIGEFNPPPFQFSKDNWRLVKDHAVAAGLLPDEKTNLGDFLEDSDTKYKEWQKLKAVTTTEASLLNASAEKAKAALRLTLQKANELKKIGKDPKLVNYLQQCVNEVKDRFQKLSA